MCKALPYNLKETVMSQPMQTLLRSSLKFILAKGKKEKQDVSK